MSQAEGGNLQYVIDNELVFKQTPVVKDGRIFPLVIEGLQLKRELLESQALRAGRNPQQPGTGNFDISGDINVEFNPFFTRIFYHLLGGAVTVDNGDGTYTHTFKIGALPPGMVVEKGWTDISKYFVYNGCRINSMSMDIIPGQLLTGVINILGAKLTPPAGASIFPAVTDTGHNPFSEFDTVGAQFLLSSVALGTATELNFTFNNDLERTNVIGAQGEAAGIPAGKVAIEGTLITLFEDTTIYDKGYNFTEESLSVVLQKGTGDGSLGNEKLKIDFPEIKFTVEDPIADTPRGILLNSPFRAFYDNDAGVSAMIITLDNTEATV